MYWEKAWRWYEERLGKVDTAGSEREVALTSLRNNAGVKLVQYMVCQRKILEELMGLQFDGTGQFSLPTFMEFGVRHFRDWLHDNLNLPRRRDALDVMTEDEFEDYRIELADEGRQPRWLETQRPTVVFFSEAFDDFLSQGADPRDHPKDWLAFYHREMGDLAIIKDGAWVEVATLLGDRYWKHEQMWDDCIAALGDTSN
ncbi:hypothetical protein JOM56_012530 [Amanita muscaria]